MPQVIIPIIDRLMRKVTILENGCWLWNGCLDQCGYGMISHARYRCKRVHVVYYEHHIGQVPSGLVLDHTCHNPTNCSGGLSCQHRKCVNPAHLEPVTHDENVRRGVKNWRNAQDACAAHQRAKTHCPKGHPYDAENTRHKTRKGGGVNRTCMECGRIYARKHMRPWPEVKAKRVAQRLQIQEPSPSLNDSAS